MRRKRIRMEGAVYHCMTRTVNGERLFGDREKEVLRKMLWQVADFSGVEVLTYCLMGNHFHVLVRVPVAGDLSDAELLRRYCVLYPKPTKYQTASLRVLEKTLAAGGDEAEVIRRRLLVRMGDVSEFMKALKQRFSVWYNRSHKRFGTLWAERFKSVLVEGKGNALQTVAAYIDLNPVRAGLVEDPKDYRFCGYAEAVANPLGRAEAGFVWGSDEGGRRADVRSGEVQSFSPKRTAAEGMCFIWEAHADGSARDVLSCEGALRMHRELIFGKRAGEPGLPESTREKALKVLQQERAALPRATVLRCRVRYFSDGAILGSREFVRSFIANWQSAKGRKSPPKLCVLPGADWGDLVSIRGLRKKVFS
ncbi:MAG: transposase [Opitutales bacterium]